MAKYTEKLEVGGYYWLRFYSGEIADNVMGMVETEAEIIEGDIYNCHVLLKDFFGIHNYEVILGWSELKTWANAYNKKHNIDVEVID